MQLPPGLIVIAYAGLHEIIFPGGPGNGDGRVRAIFAKVFGLTGVIRDYAEWRS